MSVLDVLNELASDNSSKFKLGVLDRESDNACLMEFFRLALDKSLNFYIRKIPTYSKRHTAEISLADAMRSLDKLARRVFTGNRAKFFVSKLLTQCSLENAEVIQRILKRDPDCKVSVATVNKVWPGLIKVWPCMLCERSTRKNLDGIKYPAMIQEKADGLRFNILYVDGKVKYRSRVGKFVQLHGALDDQVKAIAEAVPYDHFVIDGEGLIVKPAHFDTPSSGWANHAEQDLFEDRRTGNGIFNKAIRNTITPQEAGLMRVKVWDIIPHFEFNSDELGINCVPYKARITILKNALKKQFDVVTRLGLSLTRIVRDEGQALAFYKAMLDAGKEGAILKNLESPWEDARSKNQVKLKVVKQLDMRVTGTYPHKKKKSWVGGLTIESEDGLVRTNCGSGLKDKDRKLPPGRYLGNVVMVEANGLVNSKDRDDGTLSLYLPIFKELRIDKDEADTLQEIRDQFNSI